MAAGGLFGPAPIQVAAGEIINDQYCLKEVVGAGGYAVVWKAEQTQTVGERTKPSVRRRADNLVALKFICYSSATEKEKCLREAELVASFCHCNVLRTAGPHFDFTSRNGSAAIAIPLRFYQGSTLEQFIRAKTATEENFLLYAQILAQMLSGLAYLHERKVAHRDIKADNVFLATPFSLTVSSLLPRGTVKILDFGESNRLTTHAIQTLDIGHRSYRAPEIQSSSGSDGYTTQCDMWSVGLLMLECCTGRFFADPAGAFRSKVLPHHPEWQQAVDTEIALIKPPFSQLAQIAAKLLNKEASARLTAATALSELQSIKGVPKHSRPKKRTAVASSSTPVSIPHHTTVADSRKWAHGTAAHEKSQSIKEARKDRHKKGTAAASSSTPVSDPHHKEPYGKAGSRKSPHGKGKNKRDQQG